MRLRALISTAVIVATVLTVTPAATADDITTKRDQTKARQAQVQGQLNLALASDATVEGQLNRLNAEVAAQQNLVDDARRAQSAAATQAADATRRLAAVAGRVEETRGQLRALALRAYIHPLPTAAAGSVANINELAFGQALLGFAAANQIDVLDAYHQAQRDLAGATTATRAASARASARTKLVADQAAQLTIAQHAQQATDSELQKRIADLRQESRDLAAQETGIEALIAARVQPSPVPAATAGQNSQAGLIWPLQGPVTSEFGPRWGGFHPGIDIAPAYGTPIHAAKSGTVIFAGSEGGYGNFVLIDHGGGLVTGYAHQSRLAVTQGQSVTQGQVIGYEGSTGDSTGPHLHFEVRINGRPQNPRGYESGGP